MFKPFTLLSMSFLCTLSLYAKSHSVNYIGLGAYSGESTQAVSNFADTTSTLSASENFTLKFGTIDKKNNRGELSFSSFTLQNSSVFPYTNSSGSDARYIGLDYEGLWTLSKSPYVSPFFSYGLGYYRNQNITSTQNKDLDGFSAMVGVGSMLSFSSLFEMEIAYKYKSIFWSSKSPEIKDTFTMLYLGANIKY